MPKKNFTCAMFRLFFGAIVSFNIGLVQCLSAYNSFASECTTLLTLTQGILFPLEFSYLYYEAFCNVSLPSAEIPYAPTDSVKKLIAAADSNWQDNAAFKRFWKISRGTSTFEIVIAAHLELLVLVAPPRELTLNHPMKQVSKDYRAVGLSLCKFSRVTSKCSSSTKSTNKIFQLCLHTILKDLNLLELLLYREYLQKVSLFVPTRDARKIELFSRAQLRRVLKYWLSSRNLHESNVYDSFYFLFWFLVDISELPSSLISLSCFNDNRFLSLVSVHGLSENPFVVYGRKCAKLKSLAPNFLLLYVIFYGYFTKTVKGLDLGQINHVYLLNRIYNIFGYVTRYNVQVDLNIIDINNESSLILPCQRNIVVSSSHVRALFGRPFTTADKLYIFLVPHEFDSTKAITVKVFFLNLILFSFYWTIPNHFGNLLEGWTSLYYIVVSILIASLYMPEQLRMIHSSFVKISCP